MSEVLLKTYNGVCMGVGIFEDEVSNALIVESTIFWSTALGLLLFNSASDK